MNAGDQPETSDQAKTMSRGPLLVWLLVGWAVVGAALYLFINPDRDQATDFSPEPDGLIVLPDPSDEFTTGSTGVPPIKFMGTDACIDCHKEKVESFRHTAHFLSSAPATTESVDGKFTQGKNRFNSGNKSLHFEMEDRGDGLYQTAIVTKAGKRSTHTERFDVVTGSGKLGQTYLYFRGNRLYQLPISYVRELDQWTNNPGMPDGFAMFNRPVREACLHCHATYFNEAVEESQRGTDHHVMLGISCERCHGPGEEHVAYHRANKLETKARHIIHPRQFTSQQQHVDMCGQCHNGVPLSYTKPPFTYRPGDDLGQYMEFRGKVDTVAPHTANQTRRLALSACFKGSPEMTCVTCHNPHANERGKLALFSKRCQSCHQVLECGVHEQLGERIGENCIDCHLPIRLDKGTPIEKPNGEIYYPPMRDHAIAIYRELSERLMKELLKDK